MKLLRHDRSDALLIAATGQIDHASADAFLTGVQGMLAAQDSSRPLVLDLSAVEYISSAGLRALMVIARQVKSDGGGVGVAHLQPLVREVFAIARFDLIVPCYDDVEAAIRALA